MSIKRPEPPHVMSTLAVLIGRQPCAAHLGPEAVAALSHAFVREAYKVLTAPVMPPGVTCALATRLHALAGAFGAHVEMPRDPLGMTVGLVFPGRYTSGLRNIFFVC